jgi:hypothetical protein
MAGATLKPVKNVELRNPPAMSALAWNLKSWYGLLMPNRQRGLELVRMEFRRFLHAIVVVADTDRAQRSQDHLSDHGLQQMG